MSFPAGLVPERAFPAVGLPSAQIPTALPKDAVLPLPALDTATQLHDAGAIAAAPGAALSSVAELSDVSAIAAVPGTALSAAGAMGGDDVMKKLRLLKKIQRSMLMARKVLNTGYIIASAITTLWGLLLAGGAALAGHWGVALAQSGVSGGTLYALRKRKQGFERTIAEAESIVKRPTPDLDVFEIVSTVLKSFAAQGLDTAITAAVAALAPVAVGLPTAILHFVPVKSWSVTLGVNAGVGALVAAVTGILYAYYGRIKEMVMQRVDIAIDNIDDMPIFDFLDGEDKNNEKTPLLV